MKVSSRTPEGLPHRCPVCGKVCAQEPSFPPGDSCCPNCGHLLWWLRDHISRSAGIDPERITLSSSFREDIGTDSLDLVELVQELEEEFGVTVPEDQLARFETVEDAIRYIEGLLDKGDAA
jgi:acyl carrier protein